MNKDNHEFIISRNNNNYEVVIDKKYLSKKILDVFEKEAIALNPWDPMGSLAK